MEALLVFFPYLFLHCSYIMMWHFPMSTSGSDTKEISPWYHIIKKQGDTTQPGHAFVQRNIIYITGLLDFDPF